MLTTKPYKMLASFSAIFLLFGSASPSTYAEDAKGDCPHPPGTPMEAKDLCRKIPVSYSRDIRPILNEHCLACHQPGGQASTWPLDSLMHTRTFADQIVDSVKSDDMPHGATVIPDPTCGGKDRFVGLRLLTDEEKKKIYDWVALGGPDCSSGEEGGRAPAAQKDPDPSIWPLGKPDLVLTQTANGYPVPPGKPTDETKDYFRNFNLPDDFFKNADHDLIAMDIKPEHGTVPKVGSKDPFPLVHHVHIFIVPNGQDADKGLAKYQADEKAGKLKDAHLPGEGWEARNFDFPVEIVGSWFPGQGPIQLPPGIAQKIPKGAKLVMQVHYTQYNSAPILDNTAVGLYFARTPIHKERTQLEAVNESFLIKAGEKDHQEKTKVRVPCDATLWSMLPHQHQLGSLNEIDAIAPDGSRQCVEKLKWDFEHQYSHDMAKPIHLKAGTILEETCHWDNSASSPRQFNHPPIDIPWGPIASREMCRADYAITCDNQNLTPEAPKLGKVEVTKDSIQASGSDIKPGAMLEVNNQLLTQTQQKGDVLVATGVSLFKGKKPTVNIVNTDGGTTSAQREPAFAPSQAGDFNIQSYEPHRPTPDQMVTSLIQNTYNTKIRSIVQNKCLDCHSQKQLPLYGRLFQSYNPVAHHQKQGDADLDVSGDYPFGPQKMSMADQERLVEAMGTVAEKNSMPLASYKAFHWGTALTSAERKSIEDWSKDSVAIIRSIEMHSLEQDWNKLKPVERAQMAIHDTCYRCHNDEVDPSNNGGFTNIDDLDAVSNSKYINKSNLTQSKIYQEITSGHMPPNGEKLSDLEKKAILDWITSGANDPEGAAEKNHGDAYQKRVR